MIGYRWSGFNFSYSNNSVFCSFVCHVKLVYIHTTHTANVIQKTWGCCKLQCNNHSSILVLLPSEKHIRNIMQAESEWLALHLLAELYDESVSHKILFNSAHVWVAKAVVKY